MIGVLMDELGDETTAELPEEIGGAIDDELGGATLMEPPPGDVEGEDADPADGGG